jgi:putative endonuclease
MNCVYILECADGSLYTGWTNDIGKRMTAHRTGKGSRYTRSRLPVALLYMEVCGSKSEAMRREREIKALSRTDKLRLIQCNPLQPNHDME